MLIHYEYFYSPNHRWNGGKTSKEATFFLPNHNNFLQEVYSARKLQNKKQNVMIPVMK